MKQERIKYLKDNYMGNENFGVIHETEIPEVARHLEVSETTIKNYLKELNCAIYKRKPFKIKDLESYSSELSSLKLGYERRLPKYIQNKSVRTLVGDNLWNKVREIVLERANYCCSTCGYSPDDLKRLHVHERWRTDEDATVIFLNKVTLLCYMCHSLQHMDKAYYIYEEKDQWYKQREKLEMHFMKVNQCTQDVLLACIMLASSRTFSKKIEDRLKEGEETFLERQIRLQNAKWTYSIYDDIPLRNEIITSLQNKVNVI
ncbi:hypothetical protein PNF30_10560 [Bacillus safensis]|uniref:hypothetical protein n=1 Tax=Bacillus safensis TaxID=561879 RepID=UPI002342C24C|nr:hypothetical protein [Bacillus safensis]WCL55967.1 hypothetical protein PNF30_10560 [Bacillus safensis]